MKFIDMEHKKFYESTLKKYLENSGTIDCYSKSFFYLMGLCSDTRNHFTSLFSIKNHGIIVNEFNSAWQTGTSYKICRLAFNLWNGFCFFVDEENNNFDRRFAVDEIFCCGYAEYFFEAIRLRYSEYCIC